MNGWKKRSVFVVALLAVVALANAAERSPRDLIKAATTRPWPGEAYPTLPSLSTEMQGRVANEIAASGPVRQAYQKLDAAGRRNVDWFAGVAELEKQKAVWCLLSCLCHPHEDVQIRALRSLERLGDKRAVPFLLLYADYMAVWEEGSENATIHGIIHESAAKTLSTLTGIRVKLDGQDPEGLKQGIKKWRKWLVEQDAASAAARPPDGADRAKTFWAALAKADLNAAKEFYAPKVLLKAGSELLKPQWEIPGAADRSKDLLLERDHLIAGYRRMIEKIGRDRWTGIFSKIDARKIGFSVCEKADRPFSGVRRGDLVMKVATGPGDDAVRFVLRPDNKGRWLVVAEATDY